MKSGRDRVLEEGIFELKKTPGPGMCCVKGCRKTIGQKKFVGELGFCHRHWQQRFRARNPRSGAFRALKDHAKARGIAVTITEDYFWGLMDAATSLFPEAEKHGDKVSLDRVDATKGYERGNIQVVSVSENVAKGNRERHLPAHVQAVLERNRAKLAKNLARLADGMWVGDMPF